MKILRLKFVKISKLNFGIEILKLWGVKISGRTCDTRSSWLNCALRDDEPVYCVSIGHYEAGTVGN